MTRFAEQQILSRNPKGEHRIVYSDIGPKDGRPLLCIHGLTCNGHDFDVLAGALAQDGYRVIAPDLPGRGRSDFLPDPADYNYEQYLSDIHAVLEHLGLNKPDSVDWLGVSLGGLLGFRMAGAENSPIHRLIVNDIGPEVPKEALDFIRLVLSQRYTFDTMDEFERRLRGTRGLTWGPVTDAQWKHMAEHNVRALEDGRLTYAYDPDIAALFDKEPTGGENLWPYWEKIACPVLVLRGAESALLTGKIAEKMKECYKGHSFTAAVFDGCGHVPSLMEPGQIRIVRKWLAHTPEL
ncbi:MAG: alpha/beta hydrolase [Alphaproteobacteria bacterium]|nr:alpha/beta hydrolase [Alphaproteobacteria bacterium]